MSMAKSKALNDAEHQLREAAEAACVALGLNPNTTVWGGGLPGSFASKVLMLAAVPPQSESSNMMRRHLMEFMPDRPEPEDTGRRGPKTGEAHHKGPRRKIAPVDG